MTVTKGFILVLFLLLASLQVQVHGKVAIKVSSGKSKGKATKSNTLKTTQKGFIVPKKLTFGFMVKTFFMMIQHWVELVKPVGPHLKTKTLRVNTKSVQK